MPDALSQSAAALFGAVVCHVTTAIHGSLSTTEYHIIILVLYFPLFLLQPATGCYSLVFFI